MKEGKLWRRAVKSRIVVALSEKLELIILKDH